MLIEVYEAGADLMVLAHSDRPVTPLQVWDAMDADQQGMFAGFNHNPDSHEVVLPPELGWRYTETWFFTKGK